jgi:hypothetical protein
MEHWRRGGIEYVWSMQEWKTARGIGGVPDFSLVFLNEEKYSVLVTF